MSKRLILWGILLIILNGLLFIRIQQSFNRMGQHVELFPRCQSVDLMDGYSMINFDTLMTALNDRDCLHRLVTIGFSMSHPDVMVLVVE